MCNTYQKKGGNIMFGKKAKNEAVALGNLVEGLPVPQNSDLSIKLTPDAMTIVGCGQEFEINFSKLTLVDLKSDVEMEKIIKQSAPGMIIGAVAFGVIGAMIGGRVKTKEKRTVNHFLLISYLSDELKTIVIDVTKDWYNAAQLVDYFRKLNPTYAKTNKVSL
jgi:hypothetical protein